MKHFRNRLVEWFGFTRRERRATFILLIIILLVAAARYTVPDRQLPVMISVEAGPDSTKIGINTLNQLYSEESQIIQAKPEKSEVQDERKKIPLININICDSASLEALPGIGPVLSARIIKYRNLLGGYANVDQLREVYGLSEETFAAVQKRVYADSLDVKKIRINETDYRGLLRMPYFEKHEIAAILKYIELEGPLTGMDDLVSNRLIDTIKAKKIRPYLDFGVH